MNGKLEPTDAKQRIPDNDQTNGPKQPLTKDEVALVEVGEREREREPAR